MNKFKDELIVGRMKEKLGDPTETEQSKKVRQEKVKDMLINMIDLKSINKTIADEIVENEKRRILLNKLILQLEADLNQGIERNEFLKKEVSQMSDLKDQHQYHRNKA